MSILKEIIREKEKEINRQKQIVPLKTLKQKIATLPPTRDFLSALTSPNTYLPRQYPRQISLIAELKKASPSRGVIKEDFDPQIMAISYERAGASAISILTEEKFFQGNLTYIQEVKKVTKLPILRKDFILDSYQIYESMAAGADAILLITSILPHNYLKRFLSLAQTLNLHCLVEVHNLGELKRVLNTSAQIIGINNRNLKNFKVDLKTTAELTKFIPEDKIVVSESGIFTSSDVKFLKEAGVDAILVGEALMLADNVEKKIKELLTP